MLTVNFIILIEILNTDGTMTKEEIVAITLIILAVFGVMIFLYLVTHYRMSLENSTQTSTCINIIRTMLKC